MSALTKSGAFRALGVVPHRPTSLNSAAAPTIVKVGRFEIRSLEAEETSLVPSLEDDSVIQMHDVASGWGNGLHPTTRLCLDFVLDAVKAGDDVLDYGTGSGILSILSLRLGARHVVSVDIDDDSLRAAANNAVLNGFDDGRMDVVHTRHVYIGEKRFPLADVTVANILPGPLSRLVAPLWGLSKPGALLCLSGMRPAELAAIRSIYVPFVDLSTEQVRRATHPDFGEWVAWSVRFKVMSETEKRQARDSLTELAME